MGIRIQADQASVTEGAAAAFTLQRHGGKPDAMSRPLTVRVEVTQRGDYITGTTPETVVFPANQDSVTLTVPTENDTLDEANGRVTATILIPTSLDDDEQAYETGIYPGTPWDIHSAFHPGQRRRHDEFQHLGLGPGGRRGRRHRHLHGLPGPGQQRQPGELRLGHPGRHRRRRTGLPGRLRLPHLRRRARPARTSR